MSKARTLAGSSWGRQRAWRAASSSLMAGCLLLGALPSALEAAPTVAQALNVRPKQDGVICTTPTPEEQKECKIELDKGAGGGSGWIVKDATGALLRRFFDSNGDNKIDIWSYYKDGVEVYREVDSTRSAGKADNFRWLNAGGSKWGVDQNQDSVIDTWRMISPEEVSQELLRALSTRDVRRMQVLLITDAEAGSLGLPAAQIDRLNKLRAGAPAKFQAVSTKISEQAKWLHLETGAPQCVPAEELGSRTDLVKHVRGTILYEAAGKSDWVQTGEIIQVGSTWRLTDGPVQGASVPDDQGNERRGASDVLPQDPRVQKLVEQLSDLDRRPPQGTSGDAVIKHQLARADLLEQIVAGVQPSQRDPFLRQVADSLSSAIQAGTTITCPAGRRLASLESQLAEAMRGAPLTAYVAFRRLQAEYSIKLAQKDAGDNFTAVQQEWVGKLARFVETYPQGEDTPDSLLQLGMVNEFLNKETDAKNWYARLAKSFPGTKHAAKATGAIRRLDMEGKSFHVASPKLEDPNVAFDIDQMKGKLVVVYYWASWNTQSAADFSKLKSIVRANPSAVDLLAINLDNKADEARAFLTTNPVQATHIHSPGGLEGKLATNYGIMVLPMTFLIGRDGKVISRNIQISTVEDEIKKQLKK